MSKITDRSPADLKLVEPHRTGRAAECLPSVEGEISALASANAPFVYFDTVEFNMLSGGGGVAGLTLSASRQIAHVPGRPPGQQVASDRVIVAHLRAPLTTMLAMRATIDGIERMAQQQVETIAAAAAAEAAAAKLQN